MLTYIALGIFALAFVFIVWEIYDNSLIALSGALLMILFGVLTPEEAIGAIDFETILLLLAMMLLVNIASHSGIFEWLNLKIASWTKGNPLVIFLFFTLVTAGLSAFLDNVTTVILIVPLTIELIKGMGKDPRPYVFAEIIASNVGGALTLIGDPPNIIVGSVTGLSFLDFVVNLWIPILFSLIFTILVFVIWEWKKIKPVSNDLVELCLANVTINKIKTKFVKRTIHKDFVIKVLVVLFATIIGFFFQTKLHLPTYVIALIGAVVLSMITTKRVTVHDALKSVEWTTLFFFAGLFIMVEGVVKTGVLLEISDWIASSTTDLLVLSLLILWISGLVSVILNNIPFITIMIPVIFGIQAKFQGDTTILWWALTMGACLGGNGTIIGASANVVSADLAKKRGVNFSFLDYMKFGLPITIGILVICSIYLFFRIN